MVKIYKALKIIKLAAVLLFTSQNTFSLDEQINFAKIYYFKNTVFNKNDILVDKKNFFHDEDESSIFLDIKSNIYVGNKNPNKNIKALQRQFGLEETGIYDVGLEELVKQAQIDNSLTPTGIIDKNTWFTIYDQPKEWKLKVITQAINNWKSIIKKHKTHKNDQMIVVNIPSMMLYLYRRIGGKYILEMESKVIVGKTQTPTPLNDFEIISLKYNPDWTPTKNILKKNLYKNGKLNIKWLKKHNLLVFDENGNKRSYREIGLISNPRFIQPPGDENALGNLKFETSSNEDIYLHDTNERHLFDHNTRLYSSGCIRVQEYVKLASFISGNAEITIQRNIDKKKTFYEKLPQRVPVYFDYSQVYFYNEDNLKFFPDVYLKNQN